MPEMFYLAFRLYNALSKKRASPAPGQASMGSNAVEWASTMLAW